MKFKTQYLLFFITPFLFASCEEVVNPELVSADPVLVIDGIVSNDPLRSKIILSKTAPFNSPNPNPQVSGAQIEIVYDKAILIFNEITPGVYQPTVFQDIPIGSDLKLSVISQNRLYEATSQMPTRLTLDSISVIKREDDISLEDGYYTIAHFNDNSDAINFYMWEIYLNNEFVSRDEIILSDDENLNGKQVSFELPFSIDLENANEGDTLTLLNYSLTETAYNYYNGLLSLATAGSPAQAVPDNPVTNIRGGALGYFNSCQIDTASTILKFD